MSAFDTPWSLFIALFIFIIGFAINIQCARYFGLLIKDALLLYLWHSIYCVAYYFYVLTFSGDAIAYWKGMTHVGEHFKFGTAAVSWLVDILKLTGMSIGGAFVVFNIFGSIGLLAFYGALKKCVGNCSSNLKRLTLIVVLLPSVSFWSAGIGKDAISFMAVGLALWSALSFERRKVLMLVAIGAMLFVRPHMAGMMVMAVAFSILFQRGGSTMQRVVVGIIALSSSAIIVPFALNYAGVGEGADAAQLQQYIESRQNSNLSGGSSVDIASMSLPMQMFTYVFRPVLFEARSIPQLAAAIDNLILLYLMFYGFKELIKTKGLTFEGNRLFMWFYVLLAWVVLSMTTANLGIAMRQKWMFIPILIYLLLSILAAKEQRKFNAN